MFVSVSLSLCKKSDGCFQLLPKFVSRQRNAVGIMWYLFFISVQQAVVYCPNVSWLALAKPLNI